MSYFLPVDDDVFSSNPIQTFTCSWYASSSIVVHVTSKFVASFYINNLLTRWQLLFKVSSSTVNHLFTVRWIITHYLKKINLLLYITIYQLFIAAWHEKLFSLYLTLISVYLSFIWRKRYSTQLNVCSKITLESFCLVLLSVNKWTIYRLEFKSEQDTSRQKERVIYFFSHFFLCHWVKSLSTLSTK